MDTVYKILIYARPGHYRDSLSAVIKTLPGSELFLLDRLDRSSSGKTWISSGSQTFLLMADADGIGADGIIEIEKLKKAITNLHCIVIAENKRQARLGQSLGAEVILPRHSSAGELLSVFQKMILNNEVTAHRIYDQLGIAV